jgi:hypothetical protein
MWDLIPEVVTAAADYQNGRGITHAPSTESGACYYITDMRL